MFSKTKWFVLALTAAFMLSSVAVDTADAQRRSSSSSRYSSSSKPRYSSSKPKYSSSRPKPSTSSKPKYGTSSKPKTGSKPKYGTSSKPSTGTTKPKYGTSNKPSTGTTTSRRPTTGTTNQSRARDKAYSQRKYVETKKATAPPKPSYTTSSGKTVNVRTNSSTVKSIRSKPSSYYTPAARETRYTTVINNYGYSHPYSWYHTQPHYYVGGGYSSAFWYIMLNEWSAERRARWLYHNRASIEQDAYERGMRDAAVASELAKLKAANTSVNPDYVDSQIADNPDIMYSQDYVEAAYNPEVQSSSGGSVLLWVLGILIVGGILYFVVFRMKVTS